MAKSIRNILRLFFLLFATFSIFSPAQNAVTITAPAIDAAIAMQNRITYVGPIYPPIAKAAHVVGTVVLQIEIESDGSVGKVKIVSGPAMLNSAAVDAVKQWIYKPAMPEGSAVSTTVTIPFSLGEHVADNDNEIQKVFFPLSEQCHQAVMQNKDSAQQADLCRRSAEVASQFAPDSRYIERRSAYTYATTALLRNHEAKESLHYAEKAVEVSEAGSDDHSGRAAVYGVRGQAKAAIGDLKGSDKDLTHAEEEQLSALDSPAGHDLQVPYTRTLIGLLRFHAQVLQALGGSNGSQTKLDEAAKLQP